MREVFFLFFSRKLHQNYTKTTFAYKKSPISRAGMTIGDSYGICLIHYFYLFALKIVFNLCAFSILN